jgi:hypothetical protein
MDRDTQIATEAQMLRALCDDSASLATRQQLAQSLTEHVFIEPQHQVVFESIRALLSRGEITVARLNVHLINRGFPDTDVEKYFQPSESTSIQDGHSDKVKL